MVYFKHKKTGQMISIEELKEMGRYQEVLFHTNEYYYPFKENTDMVKIKGYQYTSGYVPFSEDFEIINTGGDFTLKELMKIFNALNFDKTRIEENKDIIDKVLDKINKEIEEKDREYYESKARRY